MTILRVLFALVFALSGLAIPIASASEGERPQPLVVAHRGLLRHAPENTLANFRACLELRLGFEFDVQRTKDGHLVCIHDDTVNRTTNGQGRVAEMTLQEIQALDAGSWFDSRFAGERVPSVEQVLKLAGEYREFNILLAADLKAANVEQDVVRLASKHKVLDRVLFIGRAISEPAVRDQIRAADINAHVAAVANNPGEFAASLSAANADWVYLRYIARPEQLGSVHRAGKRAFIAGPIVAGNLPDNWRRATVAGIDSILTDYPLELLNSLATAGKTK